MAKKKKKKELTNFYKQKHPGVWLALYSASQ